MFSKDNKLAQIFALATLAFQAILAEEAATDAASESTETQSGIIEFKEGDDVSMLLN